MSPQMVTGASTICTFDSSISSSRALWQSSRTAGSGIGLQDRSCEIALCRPGGGSVSRGLYVSCISVSRSHSRPPPPLSSLALTQSLTQSLNHSPAGHLLVEVTHGRRGRGFSRFSRCRCWWGEEGEGSEGERRRGESSRVQSSLRFPGLAMLCCGSRNPSPAPRSGICATQQPPPPTTATTTTTTTTSSPRWTPPKTEMSSCRRCLRTCSPSSASVYLSFCAPWTGARVRAGGGGTASRAWLCW